MKKIPPQQIWVALCMGFAASFLVGGYELLRSSSNTLFKNAYGSEHLPLVTALVPILIIGILFVYGHLLSWMGPRKTLRWTTWGSGFVLAFCYWGVENQVRWVTALLWIFREAYIVLILEQFWSFLDTTLESKSAKWLNGPIIGISSIGATLGSLGAYKLAPQIGTESLVGLGTLLLFPTLFFADFAYQKFFKPKPQDLEEEKKTKKDHLGLRFFKNTPIVTLLFGLVLLTQVISAVYTFSFETILQESIPSKDLQTSYSGWIHAWINGSVVFVNFIISPFILRWLSPEIVIAVLPLLHMGFGAFLIFSPSLSSSSLAYAIFKILDYSLFKSAKELLYIPLSFGVRYRAKTVIDAFGYRFSKGGTSAILFLFQKMGIFLAPLYPIIAFLASSLWLTLALFIHKFVQPLKRRSSSYEK